MTEKHVDLHMHTFYSDGLNHPKNLILAAKLRGLETIAITDHDIMNGYQDARHYASQVGMQLLPGVEVSTAGYHILGLGVDPEDRDFGHFLESIRDMQYRNAEQRIARLQAHGIPITMDTVREHFPRSRIGKYNLFMALLQDPECRMRLDALYPGDSADELRIKAIGNGGLTEPITSEDATPQEAIYRIHEAGGIAIIAHPFKDVKALTELDDLRSVGLDGLEVQPNYAEKNDPFAEYAREHGMKVSFGSDYHGAAFDRLLLHRGYTIDLEDFLDRELVTV
jgi:3',5'-nucleoside bisphosphate phosphatase